MASALETVLGIVISSKDETAPGVASAEGNISRLGRGVLGATAAWSAFGSATTTAVGFLSDAARAGADDEASTLRLQQALENTGASWAAQQGAIEARIEAGQRLAFSDDQMRDSLSLLLAQTGSLDEALKRQKLAMDLARGAHIDVVTASKLLGKVTDENVNVLGRYGISVQKGADETALFAAVQQKFGGQAETYGNSTQGAIQRVTNATDDWKESVGQALGPFQGLIALLPAASSGFTLTGAVLGPLISGVAALGETSLATAAKTAIVRAATLAWTAVQWLLNVALTANPIGIVIVAIAALVAGVIWAYQNVGWFRDAVNAAWSTLQSWAGWIGSHLQPILNWLGDRLRDLAGFLNTVRGGLGALGSIALPGFQAGGIVPGPIGAPMLAVVHGGEEVIEAGGRRDEPAGGPVTLETHSHIYLGGEKLMDLIDRRVDVRVRAVLVGP